MFYITGDKHGMFDGVLNWAKKEHTSKDDVLIILGDAGINFCLDDFDYNQKKKLKEELDLTLFCIHGNHEERPYNIEGYRLVDFYGGQAYVEDEFPNLVFAKDGEIYDFGGIKTMPIGGAYSVDKDIRIVRGWPWFESEQPDDAIKKYVFEQLEERNWKIDCVLSHTVPQKYVPYECFISGIGRIDVDRSTEEWLDFLEDKLNYKEWFVGHWHTDKLKQDNKICFMYNLILPFEVPFNDVRKREDFWKNLES